MAVNRGLSFLSNFVQKSIRRVDGALDSLKDKVVAARVIDINLNSNSTELVFSLLVVVRRRLLPIHV